MGNIVKSGNIIEALQRQLTEKLPAGWRIVDSSPSVRSDKSDRGADATLKIRGPSGKTGLVLVQIKSRFEPKDAVMLKSTSRGPSDSPVLIAVPFVSARTQDYLKAMGFGYADLTGNLRLSLSDPGLFIETTGAARNPTPASRERKSLRGAKAGRLVRALCDFRPPMGLRELAKRAGINAGYASRIIDFLDRDALVVRKERGPITEVDWPALIRRWSEEYSPLRPERVSWYLAPRGLGSLLEKVKKLSVRYAVSGSWAASQFAPVSPTRLFLCYADDVSAVARFLDLRRTEAGANVALAVPFDPVVYERTVEKQGTRVVAPSQIAADLLGSPGRGPNEADALMEWMRENENAWRA
jgi:hypothetical protein